MNKAEEKALEAFPKMSRISEPHGIIPTDNKSHYLGDANAEKREGFIKGYHQAEKDLELGWEDMQNIRNIISEMMVESCTGNSSWSTHEEFSKEVLKRFKDYKK